MHLARLAMQKMQPVRHLRMPACAQDASVLIHPASHSVTPPTGTSNREAGGGVFESVDAVCTLLLRCGAPAARALSNVKTPPFQKAPSGCAGFCPAAAKTLQAAQ